MIDRKLGKLKKLLHKIKNRQIISEPSNEADEKMEIIMCSEPEENLDIFSIYHSSKEGTVEANAKEMLISLIYNATYSHDTNDQVDFAFMKMKIIRTEVMLLLNRILAAANILVHWYNKLDLDSRQHYLYKFKDLRKLIACEFLSENLYSKTEATDHQSVTFLSTNPHLKTTELFSKEKEKILYPTAINFLYGFIKILLNIDMKSHADLLTILKAKAEELENVSETIGGLVETIRHKELKCYEPLREYIKILIRTSGKYEIRSTKSSSDFVKAVGYGCQKVKVICQIVYELNSNHGIIEPLEQLIKIEFGSLTESCSNTLDLYDSILNEIIRINNGLNLDHYFSFVQIQQNFSMFPKNGIKMESEADTEKEELYF